MSAPRFFPVVEPGADADARTLLAVRHAIVLRAGTNLSALLAHLLGLRRADAAGEFVEWAERYDRLAADAVRWLIPVENALDAVMGDDPSPSVDVPAEGEPGVVDGVDASSTASADSPASARVCGRHVRDSGDGTIATIDGGVERTWEASTGRMLSSECSGTVELNSLPGHPITVTHHRDGFGMHCVHVQVTDDWWFWQSRPEASAGVGPELLSALERDDAEDQCARSPESAADGADPQQRGIQQASPSVDGCGAPTVGEPGVVDGGMSSSTASALQACAVFRDKLLAEFQAVAARIGISTVFEPGIHREWSGVVVAVLGLDVLVSAAYSLRQDQRHEVRLSGGNQEWTFVIETWVSASTREMFARWRSLMRQSLESIRNNGPRVWS